MVKNHIKRINAPKRWHISRKSSTFISRPNPGRKLELCLPLNTVLKELLGKTKTTKESKHLIKHKSVLVNKTRRHDEKFPVGFLDVVSFPDLEEHYRLVIDSNDRLAMHKISAAESELKISKVDNKRQLKGGKSQVNCTDGRNFLVKDSEAKAISTNDTLLYAIKDQKVKDVLKLDKGAMVYLYKGNHSGKVVKVADIKDGSISFEIEGQPFETKKQYAFVIGKDKGVISIPSD